MKVCIWISDVPFLFSCASLGPADPSAFSDTFGGAEFKAGEDEDENKAPSNQEPTTTPTLGTSEGMSILQKVLFLSAITGCLAIYLRFNKVKAIDTQIAEKSLA